MPRPAKLAPTFAALALAAVALAGCAAGTVPEAAGQTPKASPRVAAGPVAKSTPTPDSTEPDTCTGMSEVVSAKNDWSWERQGSLRDLGARQFARGKVTLDGDGNPSTYTVAPGDVEAVIAERLCAYPNLDAMNHVRMIHAGQVLWLNPNPDTPWVPYFSPTDAAAGFKQIPYQQAIESAGAAVDAGDVDAVRAIWNGKLKGMFTDQGTIDAVQKVVDSGDLDALRQLFS